MRRAEIQFGVGEILNTIKKTGLDKAMAERGRNQDTKLDPVLLNQLKHFSIDASRFSPAGRAILEIFDLEGLEDPKVWVDVMTGENPVAWRLARNITFAMEYLPLLLNLIEQRGVDAYVKSVEKGRITKEAFEILSVIVLEEESQFSKPQRLIEVLQASELLYENCALLLGESPDRLTVLTCDSGSDKSFDFLGFAKVIEQVKEIILGLWDKVVFFKEKKFGAEMEAITHGLAVFAKVAEMESTGQLEPERAELIRRGLTNGCQKFLSAGAIIPEIRDHSHHNPRVLMAPEQKLLMPPAPDSSVSSPPANPPSPAVVGTQPNDEMLERMKRLEEMIAKQSSAPLVKPKKSRSARKAPERDADAP